LKTRLVPELPNRGTHAKTSVILGDTFEREGWLADWAHGQGGQDELVVVSCYSVGFEGSAASAAVDDGPFTAVADPNGDGFHVAVAFGLAVAGDVVEVAAPEAPGTVVSVLSAAGLVGDRLSAMRA